MAFLLENSGLRIEICNPNETADSHLHTRFSHCGYITQIIQKKSNEQVLGQPTEIFHPFHGSGFPDEFEIPLGYEEATCGECFLKIGVGAETKISDRPYSNWDEHPVTQKAHTEVLRSPDSLTFIQMAELAHIGYHYTKGIALNGSKLVVTHALKNTGNDRWNTLWYSHVFLPIEKLQPQAILQMNSGGKLKRNDPQMQSCSPVEVVFSTVDLDADGVCLQWDMSDAQDNKQRLLNAHGRSIYQAEGNYPYQELQIWMNHRVFSIEPKLHIDLAPGQEKRWETVYIW